ncbi:hypothetical protein [Tabrizicola aquatica]|uniref:hypothetical protein n=1 Tax=Tabrizicola aquatica TaxID=909926 RepID=UPI0011AF7FF6|nr:hypothetical protein [Tabrizicola aquatica]
MDPRITHWGEAAMLFSLDLALPVTPVIFGGRVDPLSLRDAFRHAVVQNRKAAAAGMGPQFLRDLLAWAANGAPWLAEVTEFVDTALVTVSMPQSAARLPLGFLTQDEKNRQVTQLLPADRRVPDLRQRVLSLLPPASYAALFAAADAADTRLATGQLTDWDRQMLTRNAAVISPQDPLRNLLHSADLRLREQALKDAMADLDDDTRARIVQVNRMAA